MIKNILTAAKESSIEERCLMACIYNEIEDFDEKREPTRWKLKSEKLEKFVKQEILLALTTYKADLKERIEKINTDGGGNGRRIKEQVLSLLEEPQE